MEGTLSKKKVFSAIKPTGSLTLGNYVGAIKNMIALQEEYDCFYAVADLHTVTVEIVPAELRRNTAELLALYLAFGIDPEKSTLFVQSHVKAHAELTWLLNCMTQFGEGRRMTQFKDKSKKSPENVNIGLFDYPVLMAADILLYQADYVPIGKDQQQHLELTRTVAERFNNRYSPTFKMPEGIYPKHGSKIYSLSDPKVKMSKTDENQNAYILLLDTPDAIKAKFKRAVTDSQSKISFSPDKPGVSNLLTIFAEFSGYSMREAEKFFEGRDYAYLKAQTADVVIEGLRPAQERFYKLIKEKDYLTKVMSSGAEKAERAANKTLSKVYRKMGFLACERVN